MWCCQGLPSAADADGPLQEPHHTGSKGRVTGINRVLNIADEVGKADLMVRSRPSHLGTEAVGNPDVGANVAQERLDHLLAAARHRDEAGAIGMVEDPGPERSFANPGRCLVGLEYTAGQQVALDGVCLGLECRCAVVQDVGERTFADLKPEQIRKQPGQPFERDRLSEAQIEHEGAQVRPKGRTWRTRAGGRCLEPAPTTRAGPAIERHPCYVRCDLRDFDPIVGVERNLGHSRHIRLALWTAMRPDVLAPRRIWMQRTIRAWMRLALRLCRSLAVRLWPL